MSQHIHPNQLQNRQAGKAPFLTSHAVYVLECETHDSQYIRDYAMDRIGKFPYWAKEASRYEHVYYVGATKNLYERIGSHMNFAGADFTKLFQPEGVAMVKLYDGMDMARDKERETVMNFRTELRRYCYSDLQRYGNQL